MLRKRFLLIFCSLLILVAYLPAQHFLNAEESKTVPWSEFDQMVKNGEIERVTIGSADGEIDAYTAEKKNIFTSTMVPVDPAVVKTMVDKGVKVNVRPPSQFSWTSFLLSALPVVLMLVLVVSVMAAMKGPSGHLFTKGTARVSAQKTGVTFKDVAGMDEARAEVAEIVEFLRDGKKFTELGARIPKGVLLIGPPGTGKTLLAKAVAGEANVPSFSTSGSDFVEMFVGVGAARVRHLYEQAKKNAPSIIFIDEIDAVGRQRGTGLGGGHDEREQTLNQLLKEMDGFDQNEGIVVMAATNRQDVLDPALLRAGRFDRHIAVSLPDVRGRLGILQVHTRSKPLASGVDLQIIARGTPGFSGAALENLTNEAALLAAREGAKTLTLKHLEAAKDKVLMGVERPSMYISDEEKRVIAVHEAGHALVSKLIALAGGNIDPIHKVTIIPRGPALGLTQHLPLKDRHNLTREYVLNVMATLLGGRAAEEMELKEITTGASNDIEKVTDLARRMVCEWGMSEKIGPLTLGTKKEEVFLGREITGGVDWSEQMTAEIDAEIKRLVVSQHKRAKDLIADNKEKLERLAQALIERETLDGDEVNQILMD